MSHNYLADCYARFNTFQLKSYFAEPPKIPDLQIYIRLVSSSGDDTTFDEIISDDTTWTNLNRVNLASRDTLAEIRPRYEASDWAIPVDWDYHELMDMTGFNWTYIYFNLFDFDEVYHDFPHLLFPTKDDLMLFKLSGGEARPWLRQDYSA